MKGGHTGARRAARVETDGRSPRSTLDDNDWLLSNDPPPSTSRVASTVITFLLYDIVDEVATWLFISFSRAGCF